MDFTWADKFRSNFNKFCHRLVANAPICLTYALCFALTIICIDRAEKIRFISAANNELQQNAISQEVFDGVKTAINGASVPDSFWTIVVVILCFWASQFLLRRATGLNWSRTVTLPAAIEFSSAMRKMGLFDFLDQMACVYKHRLRVHIAKTPLLSDQGENVRAKLYPYAHNDILVLEDVLTKSIGKRLLCLDADDYNSVYQQHSQTDQAIALAKIAELERAIDTLKGALSLKDDENKKLMEENAILSTDNFDLQNKLKMVKPRKGKDDKGDFRKLPLWRVLIPLGDRLKAEAKPGTQYTCPDIRKEFISELEKHPDIKEKVQKLLWPAKQNSDDGKANPDADNTGTVPEWVVNIIREDLQDLAKRTPGPPKKSKKSQRSVK